MRRFLLVLAVGAMLVFAGCADDIGDTPTNDDDSSALDGADDESRGNTGDGELAIHHIDVGQADATLLVTPAGETILIDTGDWRQDGSDVVAYLDAHDVDRIDHLVATHGHADHIGGHAAVIEHYEERRDGIGAAYDSGAIHDSATYENYLDAIDAYDVEFFEVVEGNQLPLEDEAVHATVLNPPGGDSGTDLHDNSVAVLVEFGDVSYLTTGDAEGDVEGRLVDEWGASLDATIYHAGHHGSSTSSTQPFVDAVTPDIAIVSSAYESQYGHPTDEVLDRFADGGIETYWTAVHGDVVLTTDGTTIDVETEAEFSTDAEDIKVETPDDASPSIAAAPFDVPGVPLAG